MAFHSRDKKHLFRSLVNFNLPFWLSLPLSFLENCTLNLSPDLHVSLGTCHCTPDYSVGSVGRASFSFPSSQVLACTCYKWLLLLWPGQQGTPVRGGWQQQSKQLQAEAVFTDFSMPVGFIKCIHLAPVPSWRASVWKWGQSLEHLEPTALLGSEGRLAESCMGMGMKNTEFVVRWIWVLILIFNCLICEIGVTIANSSSCYHTHRASSTVSDRM